LTISNKIYTKNKNARPIISKLYATTLLLKLVSSEKKISTFYAEIDQTLNL